MYLEAAFFSKANFVFSKAEHRSAARASACRVYSSDQSPTNWTLI